MTGRAAATPPPSTTISSKKAPDTLEVVPGFVHEKLEGWAPALAGEEDVRQALEKAFDYRGDVTVTRKDGSKVEGYVLTVARAKPWPILPFGFTPKTRTRKSQSHTLISLPWLSVIVIPPPARAGRPG